MTKFNTPTLEVEFNFSLERNIIYGKQAINGIDIL